jgi:AcrR family transcriptional regulator
MPPKPRIFENDIIEASLAIIEKNGVDALTARNIAAQLGASTRAVYLFYSSMELLKNAVNDAAMKILFEYIRRQYTELVFLNIGTGFVCFARDHDELFKMLFSDKHESKKKISSMFKDMRKLMKDDSRFINMTQNERNELLDQMWIFSHGLSVMIMTGLINGSTENIIRLLYRTGEILIEAAIKESDAAKT